jgi:gliding motility-associated-like protein
MLLRSMKKILLSLCTIFLIRLFSFGQLCTGSLGDPTVLIDFGNRASPIPPLTAQNTSYKLSSGGCPDPGEYGFKGILFGCFNNSWLTTVADHTPDDIDGYYLLVDAGYSITSKNILYSQEVNGLCPNTTYEMSVWLGNLLRRTACDGNGIKPNVTLQVQTTTGTVLGTFNTGDIYESDEFTWKEYAVMFKTPASATSVIVNIINSAQRGVCGNVIGIDDIAFRPCGPIVSAVIEKNGSDTIYDCEGGTTTFNLSGNSSPGFNNPSFQWQQSSNYDPSWKDISGENSLNLSAHPKTAGEYYYRLGVAESSNASLISCRVYSSPLTIFVNAKPSPQVTNYIYGCYGKAVVIFAAGGSDYEWSGPNGFHSNLERSVIDSAKYSDEGRYFVRITTFQGCSDTTSINLVIYPAAHASTGNTSSICEGTNTTLNASGGIKYKWYPSDLLNNDSIANPVAQPVDTTKFMVIATNEYGCTDTAYQTVNIWKKPVANAGPDKRTRVGLPVTLEGSSKGTDAKYFWTPSLYMDDPHSLNPVINATQSMFYKLNVISGKGCITASDEVFVKVYNKIIIPNAFSPNGDGINDRWNIEPLDLFNDADLQVYNRYGQLVFRNIGIIKPWNGTRNGTPLPVGTYYYVLDLKIKNEKPMTGSVTILR